MCIPDADMKIVKSVFDILAPMYVCSFGKTSINWELRNATI